MPAYDYLCEACGDHFERRQKMSEPEVASCPECGGKVKRLISGGAGVIANNGGDAACGTAGSGSCRGPEMGCGNACGCGH
jgi:putative FmdB family regulatory protein